LNFENLFIDISYMAIPNESVLIRQVASLEGVNLIVSYYLSTSEIWYNKRMAFVGVAL